MSRKTQLLSAVSTLKAKEQGGVPKIGRVSLTDKTLYLNVNVKGQGGTIALIDVNTKREVGVTNLDGNRLNAGRDYIIDGMRVLRGTTGASNLRNENYSQTGSLDQALQNAEIRIKQNGNILLDMPMSDIFNPASTAEVFRNISTSPLIQSNMEYEFEIEYPKGVSVSAAADLNIRFEFRVHQAKI
ncbi:hypothetical protein [Flavobacterium sp. I-STPA6A]|uniref:hypothetical protein n=1 Tax=Flavobacterium sp. I-STPA6A TaxID=2590450 RepID=UPI00131D3F29|nr:hypothetical protein [Flavobacterium sp. I-STPA6A]